MAAVFESNYSIRALLGESKDASQEEMEIDVVGNSDDNESSGSETTSQNPPNEPPAEENLPPQEMERPKYSYSSLITMAICSSAKKRLCLDDIFKWVQENFPYYREKDNLKNALRHNLSISKIFIRLPRCLDDPPGRGDNWAINPDYYNVTIGENTGRLRCNNSTAAPNLIAGAQSLMPPMHPYLHHPVNGGAVYNAIPPQGMVEAIYFPTPEEQMQAAHILAQQEAIMHQQRINQLYNYHHQQMIDQNLMGCHYMPQNMYAPP